MIDGHDERDRRTVTKVEAEQQIQAPGNGFGHIFQKNRWWSNPGLCDVDLMIALILADPTRVDLALAAALWGVDRIERVRSSIDAELTPVHRQVLDPMYATVLRGVRHAHEHAA